MSKLPEYATWRTDKPKEEGYSHELISNDFKKSFQADGNGLDDLNTWPFNGEVKTLYEAIQRNVKRIPDHPILGTKDGDEY